MSNCVPDEYMDRVVYPVLNKKICIVYEELSLLVSLRHKQLMDTNLFTPKTVKHIKSEVGILSCMWNCCKVSFFVLQIDFIGKSVLDFIHPEDKITLKKQFLRKFATREIRKSDKTGEGYLVF